MEYTPIEYWIGAALVVFMMVACPALAACGAYKIILPKQSSDQSNGFASLIFFTPPAIFLWWVFAEKIAVFFN